MLFFKLVSGWFNDTPNLPIVGTECWKLFVSFEKIFVSEVFAHYFLIYYIYNIYIYSKYIVRIYIYNIYSEDSISVILHQKQCNNSNDNKNN